MVKNYLHQTGLSWKRIIYIKQDYLGKELSTSNRIILVKNYLHKTGLSWSRIIYIKQDYLGQGLSTSNRIILVKDYLHKTGLSLFKCIEKVPEQLIQTPLVVKNAKNFVIYSTSELFNISLYLISILSILL